FPAVPNLFTARRADESPDAEEDAADSEQEEIPFAAHEIADVDQKLSRRRQFRTEVLEDFAEDRNHLHNQERGNRHRDANDDDRVSHRRLDFLAQARTRFQEAGEPVQNLRQQTAVLARFYHADEEPIEDA